MTTPASPELNPDLDLVLERTVAVPRSLLWRCWTEPEHLVHWFTPAPWKTVDCKIDLRPGGLFRTVMQSPEGENMTNDGCYLEVIPGERLTFTDALLPGYRPSGNAFMTATITFADAGEGTAYRAVARHADPETCQRHVDMGFHGGWSTALDQLIAHARTFG